MTLTEIEALTHDYETAMLAPEYVDAIRILLPIAQAAREYVNAIPVFALDETGKLAALDEALKGVAGE